MRSMFLRWICTGPASRVDRQDVLGRHDLAVRRAEEHVADVADLLAIGLAQLHDDRIFVAALAELRGRGAGHVGLNGGRDAGDR